MKNYNVGYLLKKINDNFEYNLNIRLSKFDLTLSQGRVLKSILTANEQNQDIMQKDIEIELKLSNPTVTGIIKRLEAKAYVYREASISDRRSKLLYVTDKAKDVDKAILDSINENEQNLLACLSGPEQDNLKKYLMKIYSKQENEND